MTVRRLVAIVLILVGVTVAWVALGSRIVARPRSSYIVLREPVEGP